MRKALVYILTFVILFTQMLPYSVVFAAEPGEADKPEKIDTVYDLVVLVVDSNVDKNLTPFEGLRGQYLGLNSSTIGDRVSRYADDIVNNNELTDVKFIFYDKNKDSVQDLSNALETLYFDGEVSGGHVSKMVGAVFIGDVPLPVVNNEGNRYISMFPYTDFVDPSYLYNQESNSFEPDPEVDFPQAEIWHGVIKPDDTSYQSLNEVAAYLDKNHLYYSGDANFAKFDKKLFFADLIAEKTKLNENVYKQYTQYLDSWEDLAYKRYNKFWAQELSDGITGIVNDLKGVNIDEEFAQALEGDPMLQIPDIYTKSIIDKLLPQYYEVMSSYIAQSNSFIENTGRYNANDVDSVPVLISVKDDYTKSYLKSVNDAIEKKINEVAQEIQEPIPLLDYSTLSGKYGNNDFKVTVDGDFSVPQFGETYDAEVEVSEIFYRFHYRNETAVATQDKWKMFVNGIDAELIDSPKLCSPYLGSTKSEYFVNNGSGFDFVTDTYSVLTQSLRSNNISTAQAKNTVGVNTRLVDKDEALSLSANKSESGAKVESNSAYGISAFIQNTTQSDYSNPLDGPLQEGDLIVKVDGVFLDYSHSLDNAVEAAFQKVKKQMISENKSRLSANLLLEYYSGSTYKTDNFAFRVDKKDGIYKPSGAIFALYDLTQGFSNEGYDNSAGCNLASTLFNSDRCFARLATMPVLDPAGSVAPTSPDEFQFPYEDIDEIYLNSCYSGLPALGKYGEDSNPYLYVLDPHGLKTEDNQMDLDFYGNYLDAVGDYIDAEDGDNQYPWTNIEEPDAGDIVINSSPIITLKDFSDRYGLFDGKDNNNNGVVDLDFAEASLDYALPSWDLDQIARRLLSHDSQFTLPAEVTGLPEDVVLKVDAHSYDDKEISSVILHNEPTDYTISEQVKSLGSFSLPIDNPRYVAFLAEGEMLKIDYPNLFDDPNLAQLQADLNAVALQLALVPESYRIFGANANAGQYSTIQIQKKILEDYLQPVLMETELYDALAWKGMNIDEKHAYILKNYINGYEAAYLVLDGEENYFDIQFNKDLTLSSEDELFELNVGGDGETDSTFDEFNNAQVPENGDGSGVDSFENRIYNYVELPRFFDEVSDFIDHFTTEPNFTQACVFDDYLKDIEQQSLPSDSLSIDSDRSVVAARSSEKIVISIEGPINEVVDLQITQTSGEENFILLDGSSKILTNGKVQFSLGATNLPGTATLQAVSQNGLASSAIQIRSTANNIFLDLPEKIVADGATTYEISAQLLDENGGLNYDSGGTVDFSIIDGAGKLSFVGSSVATVINGRAKVTVKAGNVSGDIQISAEASADGYPIAGQKMHISAGDPYSIVAVPQSSMLVANNQSKTRMDISVLDKFGNVVNDSFAQVALFSSENLSIDSAADLNSSIIGTQLMTMQGQANVDIFAKNSSGQGSVIAILLTPELEEQFIELGDKWQQVDFSKHIGTAKSFNIVDPGELDLNISLSNEAAVVGGDIIKIRTELLNGGQRVSGYSGPIEFHLGSDAFGGFVNEIPAKMSDGVLHEANVQFKTSNKAGELSLIVNLPGYISDSISLKVMPGVAQSIELTSSEDSLKTDSLDEVVLEARILDQYGNIVFNDNSSVVNFAPTDGTADFVKFSGAQSAFALEGVATTTIRGGEMSGKVNLRAGSAGLNGGGISLDVLKRVDHIDVDNFAPRAMYVSLLGGAFGDRKTGENLASSILFSGASQAVSTVTAVENEFKKIFGVDAFGRIDILDANVQTNVLAANDSFPYQKIVMNDNFLNEQLAEIFLVPKVNSVVHVVSDLPSTEGIFVQKISDDEKLKLSELDGSAVLKNESDIIVSVDNFGRISLNNDLLKMKVDDIGPYFALIIEKGGEPLMRVVYQQNFDADVKILDYGNNSNSLFPGIYLKIMSAKSNYLDIPMFSGSSSAENFGAYLVDSDQKEDDIDLFGSGFKGENKNMLLFAGGNSVGESNRVFASDKDIVYGDPLISVDPGDYPGLVSNVTNFSKDIGVPILSGKEDILDALEFDYNADGYMDLLAIYENGLVRLLENEVSNKNYRDRGYILNISEGILSAAKADVNNDGYDDLIVGTKESCRVGDTCLSLFMNDKGNFRRDIMNIDLAEDTKIYELKSGDLNNDGCSDVVFSDSAANIQFLYNEIVDGQCGRLVYKPSLSKNFGVGVDSNVNAVGTLYANYPGMPQLNESNAEQFVELESDFIKVSATSTFGSGSSREAIDINGGTIVVGDEIQYIVTLKNNSSSLISNLRLSDNTPAAMELIEESLKCMDPNCADDLSWSDSGQSLRSKIIEGINVPAGGSRTISYKMKIKEIGEVHFELGHDLAAYKNDQYLDILVRPTINPEGKTKYLYSDGVGGGLVQYKLYEENPSSYDNQDALSQAFEDSGLPDLNSLLDFAKKTSESVGGEAPDPPADLQDSLTTIQNSQANDSDYNGCTDSWESLGNTVKAASAALKCGGGGCAPTPYNYAFLAPDDSIPGTAVLAFGVPPLGFATMYSSALPSSVRLYLNPTLTLGLGTAICVGTAGHASPCFAAAVPVSNLGLCPDFTTPINDAISSAKDYTLSGDAGMMTVVSDGSATDSSDAINASGSFSDPSSPVSASGSVNIKVPGFPSAITNWIDKQTDEIYNKLLDLPDFYLIYPDAGTLVKDENLNFAGEIHNIQDFLSAVNSIPLINIETREVLLKIPTVSEAEIIKYKQQAAFWIDHQKDQLVRLDEFWSCDSSSQRERLCDVVRTNLNQNIASVEQFMGILDELIILPQKLLNWRTLESKYATQIVCYLDAIMNYTSGYLERQQATVESWMKAARDAVKTFETWKVLLDVMVDYQESCDECKSDRFSKLGLLMQVFVAIPEPPVIPLPKWPDIVVDISQIRTGVTIVWPDIKFEPELVELPDLPVISLPDISALTPDFTIDDLIGTENFEIPHFEVPQVFLDLDSFDIPNLPDLPILPLPDLPDLPRPPKIPKMPDSVVDLVGNLKPIFQILCLLKQGLIPIPEGKLATEIETLTQPSVQTVLPVIKDLGVQLPAIEYDYLSQIRVNAKMDFGIDTELIYGVVKLGTEISNYATEKFVENVNKFTELPLQKWIDDNLQKAVDDAAKDLNSYMAPDSDLSKYVAEMQAEQANYPETFYLTAGQELLDPGSPLLNRSLADLQLDIENETLSQNGEMDGIYALRGELLAYAQGLNSSNQLLEGIDNYDDFSRIIVESDQSLNQIAALANDGFETVGSDQVETSFFEEGVEDRLLAFDPGQGINQGQAESSTASTPIGFYIVVDGENENVLNYTEPLTGNVHTLFTDADQDLDEDIIMVLGGDIYMKENHKIEKSHKQGKVIASIAKTKIADYNPQIDRVSKVNVPFNSYKKSEVFWSRNSDNSPAYEIYILNSLDQEEKNAAHHYLAIADEAYSYKADEYEQIFTLSDPENPRLTLEMDNGNYYIVIYALDSDGNKSMASLATLISPQICGDDDAPFPSVSADTVNVSVYENFELDASGSFDPTGEVTEYSLEIEKRDSPGLEQTQLPKIAWDDVNEGYDSDGDGISSNDHSNPKLKLGPFTHAGDKGILKTILHIADQSGNSSEQAIDINVFVPDIHLDESLATSAIVSGEINPLIGKIPYLLMRERFIYRVVDNALVLIPRIESLRKGFTESDGTYEISDLNSEHIMLVENSKGEAVAEINTDTGNVKIMMDGYKSVIKPALPPTHASNVQIVDSKGNVMSSVYVVTDPNIDVAIDNASLKNYDDGVHFIDKYPEDEFVVIGFAADDPSSPGGAALFHKNENKQIMSVDSAGNVIVLDERVKLSQNENDHNSEPLAINVSFEGKIIAEIYLIVSGKTLQVVSPNDVPVFAPKAPSTSGLFDSGLALSAESFLDVSDELKPIVADLYAKGIIDPLKPGDSLYLNPQHKVTRGEFTKTLLIMLCIVPREEAYEAFKTGGFSDILLNDPDLRDYYAYIREAAILNIIDGYKGTIDPVSGLNPFKPYTTISRAEAVKIILEALQLRGIIDIEGVTIGNPWYEPFMDIAQNMDPYLVTAEEAANPTQAITYEDMLLMASRVLDLYDCFELDSDKGGVNDGGVADGQEQTDLTDPLDGSDDNGLADFDGDPGIYAVPAECNTCPCISTLVPKADISAGDTFFTVIPTDNFDEQYFESKSNEVIIKSVNP